MKVVCIDPDFSKNNYVSNTNTGHFIQSLTETFRTEQTLEFGKIYDGELIFNIDGKVNWENNVLNIEGFSEIDWFPTQNFVTLDVWRQKLLDELLSISEK